MFPWEHITWMGFVTVITEYRSEGTCLYREGAFSVSLKNRPRRVFTLNYFMEVSGRCIMYFQHAQLWNIWENTVKKPAFFRNAGFFREKRDDFAKIAALNAALFDRTLRFFLPGRGWRLRYKTERQSNCMSVYWVIYEEKAHLGVTRSNVR